MSHTIRFITLTGVDDATALAALTKLSSRFPFVEWGVLYDSRKAGVHPRYPALEFIERFVQFAREHNINAALHLCGPIVKELAQMCDLDDAVHPVMRLARQFGRVQLNVNLKKAPLPFPDLEALRRSLSSAETRTRVILQHHAGNAFYTERLLYDEDWDVLLDESGGRGTRAQAWPNLNWAQVRHVGFAGGIGPDNIEQVLRSIRELPLSCPFSLDMEQRIRNDQDRLDLARCEVVLRAAERFIQDEANRSPC
jgi:hypothetical protein